MSKFESSFLVNLVGETWYNQLKDYLESEEFYKLGFAIANLRNRGIEIYPPSELIFRAFKETPYDEVKVILLAMDPYNNSLDAADGLAFSNSRAFRASPSIKIILEEIDNEYPEWKGDIEHGRLGWCDLKRWAEQGVFLYNSALTVEKDKPGSHIALWTPFTNKVVEALNRKNDLIWILLGKEAQKFSKKIGNQTHTVLEAPHPAAETYRRGAGFLGSGVFRKANEELIARNKSIIYW